jgi:hypothetical protein
VPEPLGLLTSAYRDLSAVLSSLTVEEGWEPTGSAGWTAVDLGFHLLSDARRALVALASPADGPADTTAVDYWTAWRPPGPGDDLELWTTRVAASVHGGLAGIAGRYAETSAAVHHLDLVLRLDRPGPAAGPLGEVRRVLEGLLGRALPGGWDDVTAARRGTGREPLTEEDRTDLGPAADAFPLFG